MGFRVFSVFVNEEYGNSAFRSVQALSPSVPW